MYAYFVFVDEVVEAVMGAHGIGVDGWDGFGRFADDGVGDLGLNGGGGELAGWEAAGARLGNSRMLWDRNWEDFFVQGGWLSGGLGVLAVLGLLGLD